MSAKIVNGRKIAKEIRNQISKEIIELKSKYKITPSITTIKVGKDPTSELYLRLRDNACKEVGIKSNHLEFSEDVSENKILVKMFGKILYSESSSASVCSFHL